jgi:rhodanese-related sulfurtransferase
MCGAPYRRGFLERFDAYFCSYACWFDYLKSRPRPAADLIGPSGTPVPQEVFGTPHRQIDVEQARQLLASGSGYAYLDVRSVPEFDAGHPAGAYNIPLLHRDRDEMVPNPQFLKVAQIVFDSTARLIVGCQSGSRSRRAAELLSASGFAEVCEMRGGFGGLRDARGQSLARGWLESGYPVEYGPCADRSYSPLAVGA